MTTSSFCPFCGADNLPDETHCFACHKALDRQEGAMLLHRRYEVMTEVGSGGFGAVYKAQDTREQNRLVAVKQINLKGLTSQEIIEATDAFNREAEILAVLSHPLLPRIFDRFSDPEHWYLVMNFIDGQTLDEYLQDYTVQRRIGQSGLPLEETLVIGQQLCNVLLYLHTQQPPIIFRDLKPGNIMRTRRGQLYLIDFGIARRFKPGQAKDTTPFGSPGFASPEQYGRAQTTPQADIYSLGALLYCLISGDDPSEHPFQFAPLRLSGVDGMRQLNALIQRMVSLAPEDRPATIQDVQNELQQIQHLFAQTNANHIWLPPQGQTPPVNGGIMQHIMPKSPGTLAPRKTSRRRVLTVGLIVGGILAGGGLVDALVNSQSHTLSVKDQGIVAPPTATANSQEAGITATETSSVAVIPLNGPAYWSPDLSHAVVVNFAQNQLEIYALQGSKLLSIVSMPVYPDNTMGILWSPDMSKIFLFSDVSNAVIYEANHGKLLFKLPSTWTSQAVFSSTSQPIFPGAWSPDGNYFALSYSDDTGTHFIVFSATDGQQIFTASAVDYTFDSLAWSPDSKSIAFASIIASAQNSESWIIKLWSRETQQVTVTLNGVLTGYSATDITGYEDTITSVVWAPGGQQLCIVSQQTMWICSTDKEQQTVSALNNMKPFAGLAYGPVWSPNKKYLAALMDEGINLYDLTSQQILLLNGDAALGKFVAFAWAADSKTLITVDDKNILAYWPVD